MDDYFIHTKPLSYGESHMGKIDSYVIPLNILSENPWKLVFGLGVGNVAGSSLRSFSGEYAAEYAIYGPGVTATSQLIWEVGVFGILVYLSLLYSKTGVNSRLSRVRITQKPLSWRSRSNYTRMRSSLITLNNELPFTIEHKQERILSVPERSDGPPLIVML